MRGANMIPMETLEGRYVPGMHRALVKSAAAGNMNLLRIWGGGVYIFEEFTDACDEEGNAFELNLHICLAVDISTRSLPPACAYHQRYNSPQNHVAIAGVMVYEDMMYGTDGIMPGASNTSDQEAELRYQIRRQAHHPCEPPLVVHPKPLCSACVRNNS